MTFRFPSGFCGLRWVRRPRVWRTHGSSDSSTTTGRSPITRATRHTAASQYQPAVAGNEGLQLVHVDADGRSAAANKGLALFPRRFRGHFAAMSRSDRESNSFAFSDCPFVWTESVPCQQPTQAWEALQLGNCGPPIETEAGWLVLTHGVGPMRTYRIGAILLDLENPSRISRAAPRAVTESRYRRAGRLRPERRLLVRRACACRNTGRALWNRRRGYRFRDRPDVRTPRRNEPLNITI